MVAKTSKVPKGGKSKQKGQEDQREQNLQAVVDSERLFDLIVDILLMQVLADSFETRFTPFTLERPRVGNSLSLPSH